MTFECKENCGECCGPVFIDEALFTKNRHKITNVCEIFHPKDKTIVVIQEENGRCGFLDNATAKCKIYEERPQVCENYGITERLPCPYFKPNGNKRSKAMGKRISREARNQFNDFQRQFKRQSKMGF